MKSQKQIDEEVEVVGYRYSVCGDLLLDHCKPSLPHDQLMTVAQHQRIVEQLEKDSARYRWLVSHATYGIDAALAEVAKEKDDEESEAN